MQTIEISLPDGAIVNAKSEIYSILIDKAISKIMYYKSKEGLFEHKYKMSIDVFKQKVENENENFEFYDDLIIWEGYHLARIEWENRYKELKLV